MSILSVEFFIMVAVATIIYWIVPSKYRWTILLMCSLIFAWSANKDSKRAFFLMLIMVGAAYLSAFCFQLIKKDSLRKITAITSVLFEVILLISLKESSFFLYWFNLDLNSISPINLIAPFGISYYTLTLIGYILNCYWKVQKVEENPLKFLLFGTFFPLLTSGPIVKYSETGEELLRAHKFSYKNIAFGCQRILWGIFKKLVISERLSILVTAIYSDSEAYPGLYVWLAVILFVLQLYTDFSGCLDIIYGVSELFGIQLPENFNHPFAAKNLSEFWRRWHITLGNWLKEYVFYPIMKSKMMISISEFLKRKIGKKYGKKVTSCIGLFFSWFLIGFWHGGGMNYIVGVGLWMWFVISLSELLGPVLEKLPPLLGIDTKCYSWELFQKARTFVLFALGNGLFRAAGLQHGIKMYLDGVSVFNPWIFFDGSLLDMGLTTTDINVLVFSVMLLVIAGEVSLRINASLREWISGQNFVFRWLIWLTLFFVTLVYGKYGPGYSAAEFIYKGF